MVGDRGNLITVGDYSTGGLDLGNGITLDGRDSFSVASYRMIASMPPHK